MVPQYTPFMEYRLMPKSKRKFDISMTVVTRDNDIDDAVLEQLIRMELENSVIPMRVTYIEAYGSDADCD